MRNFPQKITIIGVGLIGGSIALGLKRRLGSKITVLGLCSDIKRAKLAQDRGIIDQALSRLIQIPKSTNLVILATPVSAIIKIIPQLKTILSKDCLIMDTGSTKDTIIKQAELNPPNFSFIATHPMAGNDFSGFENADPFLFQNKPWIICFAKNTDNKSLEIANQLIELLGAKKMIMEASLHDKLTAFSSHLPLILGSILVSVNVQQPCWDQIAKIASNGFRDTSRLASHNPKVKTDIVFSNKTNIIPALQKTKIEINRVIELLQSQKANNLFNYFNQAKKERDKWFLKYFR